ncbi:lumenal Hsp70 protein [Recurvomyces mirabilis]|uniref:Lumenal Hsp70 protein n=1 Tax=Recurvomyces mirabilis TaxID=574656 RepID=A0AAE0TP24_9PEZI|nr:lumenal Hsp70 protein [Recurvomyces mirabilis]KAK5161052.1 lumenal Hsp70 protein [Recurvomyces mirabilis]
MLPPGRRRANAIFSLPPLLLLTLLALLIPTTHAAGSVLGVDFGTAFLKAALVKPGIPLEIVLTKDSKRKEAASIAFKPTRGAKNEILAEAGVYPERAYGGDSLAIQGRFPGEVFPNLKSLLGLEWTETRGWDYAVDVYTSRYPAVQARQDQEAGTVLVTSSSFIPSEAQWSVEELLAMELASIKRNAESMAGKGSSVEDAVITIPGFYTAEERRAVQRAAELAGLNVNALITDGLAVGLDYAKSRTFPEVSKGEKPEYHVVYDMGAGSTTATLLRMQSRSVKDVGRFNKTVQEVAVVATGWDKTLGGDALNQVVLDDFVHKLLTKPVLKSRGTKAEEITSNGRAMSRLWKDAEKARQVLSANAETSSSFEEILPEIDFRVKLTRTEFETLTESFLPRVTEPIENALFAAKLEISDLTSIILHGGAVRTPFVQRKLEELVGPANKNLLRSNVNADESSVFGAAFKGAGLSPSFKVKEIRDSDVAGYAAGMKFREGGESGKERRQQIFSAQSPVGSGAAVKQVTFKDKEDFEFSLWQNVEGGDRAVVGVVSSNLTAGVKKLHSDFGCEKEDVQTKFSLRLSPVDGLPEVVGGSVSCEVEGAVKKEGGSVIDSAKDWLGFGGKKDQEPLKDGEEEIPVEEVEAETSTSTKSSKSKSSKSTSSTSGTASASKILEKPKKRTESIPVAFTTSPLGLPQPKPSDLKRMRDRLAAFDRSDKARVSREEALNVLESYTYYVRDFLGNDDYVDVSTDTMREEIGKLLGTTRSFMENPGDVTKATEAVLREKLAGLKGLVEPIKSRRTESLARPEKVETLRKSLEQTNSFIETVKGSVEQAALASASAASASEASAAEASSSSSTETPAPSSASGDGFDDLEEPETSSSSSSAAAKETEIPAFSPYTSEDVEGLESAYTSAKKWLEEKEAEQGKLKLHEEPVLLVKDIEREAQKLSSVMTDLVYKKMRSQPPPKKSSSSKSKSAKPSKSKAAKKGKGKSSTADAGQEEATASSSGKAARITVGADDEMPTEEEILRMVKEAREEGAGGHEEL